MSKSVYIPITRISIKAENPRKQDNDGFEPEKMEFLRESIRTKGLDAPLVLQSEGDNKFRVVAGERRFRSIQRLVEENVECYDQTTGSIKSAHDIYVKSGVECKVKTFENPIARRIMAIQENVLHEPLSEVELLEELAWMQANGITDRTEQGKVLARCAAWISQSHSLLDPGRSKILEYMRRGRLTRTAAISFINVPTDRIDAVLEEAESNAKKTLDARVGRLEVERDDAAAEIARNRAVLGLAAFTGKPEDRDAKTARRVINTASKKYGRAAKAIESTPKDGHITDSAVISATKQVGAADRINRPRPPKDVRDRYDRLVAAGSHPDATPEQFRTGMAFLKWMLDCTTADDPFDLVDE